MLPTPAMNPSRPQLSRYGWRPVDPPRRPVLFVNPRSGDGKALRAGLAERARAKGIETVILAPGQDLAALAREAVTAGADALGMAGGDGSLAVVAAAAAAHGIPFVCVRRWTAASSASSSSTHPATARTLQGKPGPRRGWR